jgi:hypothetical protein
VPTTADGWNSATAESLESAGAVPALRTSFSMPALSQPPPTFWLQHDSSTVPASAPGDRPAGHTTRLSSRAQSRASGVGIQHERSRFAREDGRWYPPRADAAIRRRRHRRQGEISLRNRVTSRSQGTEWESLGAGEGG